MNVLIDKVVGGLKALVAPCLLGIVLVGCGGTVGVGVPPGAATTPGPPNEAASPLHAGTDPMTALSQRPLRLPVVANSSSCPATSGAELGVAPDFGFGLGPAYLSGQDAWYADGQAAILMVDARYSGPLLVRGSDLSNPGSAALTLVDLPAEYMAATQEKERVHAVTVVSAAHTATGGLFLQSVAPTQFWRGWFGSLRTTGPGCFGLQLDGDVFTEFIVFAVHAGKPPPG